MHTDACWIRTINNKDDIEKNCKTRNFCDCSIPLPQSVRLSQYIPCHGGPAYPCLSTVFVPVKPECYRRILLFPTTDLELFHHA